MAEDELVGAYGHVVPQVVKAELGVGHVGDVGEVGLAATALDDLVVLLTHDEPTFSFVYLLFLRLFA